MYSGALSLARSVEASWPLSEAEVISYFQDRAKENSFGYTSFLGAGVYNHLRSVITDTILLRGEFLTSYTPYQAEITQGTLQAIFEFQTLMCSSPGRKLQTLDVRRLNRDYRSCAHGGTPHRATARACREVAAPRISRCFENVRQEFRTGCRRDSIWREWHCRQQVPSLYAQERCSCGGYPVAEFFGVIEDVAADADAVHAAGALLVVAIAEGVSLGALRPPARATL